MEVTVQKELQVKMEVMVVMVAMVALEQRVKKGTPVKVLI